MGATNGDRLYNQKDRQKIMFDKLKKWLFPEELKYTTLIIEEPERKVEVVKKATKKAAPKKKAPAKKCPAKKTAPKKTTKKSPAKKK
jgi:hypothetical protein